MAPSVPVQVSRPSGLLLGLCVLTNSNRLEMSQKSSTRCVNWPRLYSRFLNTFLFEMATWLSAFVRGLDGMEEEMEWRGKPCRESRDDAAGV